MRSQVPSSEEIQLSMCVHMVGREAGSPVPPAPARQLQPSLRLWLTMPYKSMRACHELIVY